MVYASTFASSGSMSGVCNHAKLTNRCDYARDKELSATIRDSVNLQSGEVAAIRFEGPLPFGG